MRTMYSYRKLDTFMFDYTRHPQLITYVIVRLEYETAIRLNPVRLKRDLSNRGVFVTTPLL